jgi:Tfp pilus assembly protein PilF
VTRKARPQGRGPTSRAAKKLYARLGLTPEASDQEVQRAREELVGFLESAPDGARRWARNEIAAVNDAHARLTGSARSSAEPRVQRRRRIAVGLATLAITVGVVVAVYNTGGQDEAAPMGAGGSEARLSPSDEARVTKLMKKVEANPKDAAALVSLGNAFFKAGDYNNAGGWMEQALAVDPQNVDARLALGASQFNLSEVSEARKQWEQVISLDPKNVEAYYDLGFLYLSEDPPEMAKTKAMWRKVVELAPAGSSVAKTVSTHLKSLEKGEAGAGAPATEG